VHLTCFWGLSGLFSMPCSTMYTKPFARLTAGFSTSLLQARLLVFVHKHLLLLGCALPFCPAKLPLLQAKVRCLQVLRQPTPPSSEARQQQQQQQIVYPTYLLPDKQPLTHQASQPAAPGAVAQPAELEKLSQAVREAEQRAYAAEVAITMVQRAHTEAVEQSARLQASHTNRLTRHACTSFLHVSTIQCSVTTVTECSQHEAGMQLTSWTVGAALVFAAASNIANALGPDFHWLYAVAGSSDVNSSQPGSTKTCKLLAAELAHVPALQCCSG